MTDPSWRATRLLTELPGHPAFPLQPSPLPSHTHCARLQAIPSTPFHTHARPSQTAGMTPVSPRAPLRAISQSPDHGPESQTVEVQTGFFLFFFFKEAKERTPCATSYKPTAVEQRLSVTELKSEETAFSQQPFPPGRARTGRMSWPSHTQGDQVNSPLCTLRHLRS